MPADFPADVPIPAGTLAGSSGSAGHWSLLLHTVGPADQVLSSTVRSYESAGFTATSPSTVTRGPYTIAIAAENRDHVDLTAATLTVVLSRN